MRLRIHNHAAQGQRALILRWLFLLVFDLHMFQGAAESGATHTARDGVAAMQDGQGIAFIGHHAL
ncbi:MAG: hypothetical protein H5U14_08565, partial [Roseovarius sp.]|nr:hypothetical protein [Roseovarius sp.]